MAWESKSTNPVVRSIISGNAPPAARSAAARGLLPLPQDDLLEALVHLTADNDPAIARAAQEIGAMDDVPEPPAEPEAAEADDAAEKVPAAAGSSTAE